MYSKIPNGTTMTIQGLTCNIPPLGMGVSSIDESLAPTDVIKRSKKPAEQYWEAPTLPEDWEEREEEEYEQRLKDPQYINFELEGIREREWKRRIYGVWFWNNGKPVYIPGRFYYYLTYWQLDTGLPSFRIVDLEYFYFWEYIVHDPLAFGLIEVRKRRDGKTARPACIGVEIISRTKRAMGGIQSKNDKDAKKVFEKHVVPAFQQLPSFFRPKVSATTGNTPLKSLKFVSSQKGKSAARKMNDKDQLRSELDYRSSNPLAYDGDKLIFGLWDESGKTDTDVVERHGIVRRCFMDHTDAIIGKMIVTSTVEEIGIKYRFKELWKDSNQFERQADGATITGLYQFFIPSDRCGEPDVYGYGNVEETRERILLKRKSLLHKPKDYINEIRKQPLSIEEAFRITSTNGHYNDILLGNRQSELDHEYDKNFWTRGNFDWKNGERFTEAIWVPNDSGRWLRCWAFENEKDTNKVIKRGNYFMPGNKMNFVSGCDPVDHDKVEDDGRASKAASYVLRRHNPLNGEDDPFNKAFVCEYVHRHEYSKLFYEDMIKQCFYFGCPILAENNKNKIVDYFRDKGCGDFLIHLPGYKEPGIPATPENKLSMVEVTEEYIATNISKVYYSDLITQWIGFDVGETQKFDMAMAAGWTLIADMSYHVKQETSEVREITDYLRMHKAS